MHDIRIILFPAIIVRMMMDDEVFCGRQLVTKVLHITHNICTVYVQYFHARKLFKLLTFATKHVVLLMHLDEKASYRCQLD